MNRFKLEAYCQEFPFLREILADDNPDSIRVARADGHMVQMIPASYYWDGSLGRTDNYDAVYFVFQDGSILPNAVRQASTRGSNYAGAQTEHRAGESILEAIDRLGIARSIAYVVLLERQFSSWSGQDTVDRLDVTIYKAPKGRALQDYITQACEEARQEVIAETSF